MIPRTRRPSPPSPDQPIPVDAGDPIAHQVVDIDFVYGPGEVVSVTLTERDTLTEQDDRFVLQYANGEICSLYKRALRWTSRRPRTYYTLPPLFTPNNEPSLKSPENNG